ncbi:LytR/AlgR family response regulator transcription factor [Salinibacter grassmerensis]|uniref:LytR/AlgR family response regulator transcription factor n=1 Tax=Salinibacter grassmerensis TaxID=3040353 RepID=UPI0021E8B3E9|nr:response regulator [Salinibacter grassmerensis]
MPVRCLLVDDEPLARERLRALLGKADVEAQIVAEADGGEEAASLIHEHRLDAVFLDVQMPVLDGFDVVDLLPGEGPDRPHIVFVTAHNEHATEAFKVQALDYLTKPVRLERLNQTLHRVQESSPQSDGREAIAARSPAREPRRSTEPRPSEDNSVRSSPEPGRSALGDLLYRRIPQVLGGYLGVTWTLFELTQWLAEQYPVPPDLGRIVLFGLLLLLPSVLMVAYRHGRPGPDQWTRGEQASLAGNLVVAVLLLITLFGDVGPGM